MAEIASPKSLKRRRMVWIALLVVLCGAVGVLLYFRLRAPDVRHYKRAEQYLELGSTAEALYEFRAALAANPKYLEARIGIVKALTARKDFARAFEELETAARNGLKPAEAALLKAQVLSVRADHHLASAGEALSATICEEAILGDVDPAIEIVTTWADKAHDPAAAYSLLGDLRSQKGRIAVREWEILVKEYNQAREQKRDEDANAKEEEIRAALPKVRSVEGGAIAAYTEAIRRDPNAVHPRVAIAKYAIQAYLPRPQQALTVLQPLMSRKPIPPDALEFMALAEWYAAGQDPAHHAVEYDRALAHVRALVEAKKDNPLDALLLEAEILIEAGRWSEAADIGSQVVVLDAKGNGVAYVMGRILMHQDQPAEAVNNLQNIFTDPKTKWPQARLLLADALWKMGRTEQAIAAYRLALDDLRGVFAVNIRQQRELLESQYRACLALGRATRELEPREALDNASRALGLFPERAEAFRLTKELYQAAHADREKIEDLVLLHAHALDAAPGRSEEAMKLLAKEFAESRGTIGKGARLRLLMARLLVKKASYREAIVIYEELRKAFPNTSLYAYELARLYTQLGGDHNQEARAVYEALLATDPHDMRAFSGLMSVLIRMKDLAAARAVLERVAGQAGSEQVWAMLLEYYMRQNRLDEGVALAKSCVEQKPTDPVAQVALAELLWKRGDLKEARSAFDRALKLAPDFPPGQRRAFLDLQEGRVHEAVVSLRNVVEKSRTQAWQTALAVALQAQGEVQEAGDILKDISSGAQGPSSLLDVPRWYLAVLRAGEGGAQDALALSDLIAQGDFLGASQERTQLLQRLAALPEPARSEAAMRLNLAILFGDRSCPGGALQQLALVAKLLPGEPLSSCWRIQLLGPDRYDDAVKQYGELIRAHPDFIRARSLLAEAHERHGNIAEAAHVLEDTLTVTKGAVAARIQLQLGRMYEDQGQLEEAIASYQAAMTQPECRAYACNNLAWLYVTRRNDISSALPLAEQAGQLAANDPIIQDTLGWILYLKGENNRSVFQLTKARSGLPGLPTVRYHLGMALLKAERKTEAKAEFEEALTISKDFPEAADAAAQLERL